MEICKGWGYVSRYVTNIFKFGNLNIYQIYRQSYLLKYSYSYKAYTKTLFSYAEQLYIHNKMIS